MRHPRSQVQGLLGTVAVVAIGLAVSSAGSGADSAGASRAAGGDRDCADFETQREAQNFFEANQPGDPHRLDGDGDGRACEDLPCPCGSGGGGDPDGGGEGGNGKKRAVVAGITDGDTIKIRRRDRTEDVRLIGIDTPEVYFGAECGGAQASASMRRMLEVGNRVRLFRDPSQDNRDAYGRLLRYVERKGRDIGRKQIRKGWAKVYVFESPFGRVSSYGSAKRRAKSNDRGVWRRCGGDFHLPL
jgi:endonuclease YncB( thermonuclease family)